ncbi:MAG: alanine--glyoxylate aminotransferase family protein [Desulfarculaceae bacterium]|nr:alanine--glyoxylate aminotransferase family protein [Desulfarculaceae bacterium]
MDELKPPQRLLLGPGPCNVPYRVLRAMSTPLVGHLDPLFMQMMDEVCSMLRDTFQTTNQMTFPVSGTGSAGMEACFVNLLEPGDTAVVCINGVFGTRMADVAERCGAKVIKVEAEWGGPLDQAAIIDTLKAHPEAKLCAIVYAETSTGVLQPIQEIGAYLKDKDTLFLVDAVTALGGVELKLDEWGIDACYSGTQKCLAVPPGLAPVSFGPKALEVLKSRKSKVQSWYLDLTMLMKYWGSERLYHHTAPITMIYGLREGLRIIQEEGLQNRIERHAAAAEHLRKGLAEMGFSFWAAEGYRLPPLTSVFPPDGWDVEGIRKQLLADYDIELGGGLGPVAGKIWRIGLMGENACVQKVAVLLRALADFA